VKSGDSLVRLWYKNCKGLNYKGIMAKNYRKNKKQTKKKPQTHKNGKIFFLSPSSSDFYISI